MAEGEEVVVVAAYVASLDADTGVVEGLERGECLGEEAGLDLSRDLELLCGAAFGLDFFNRGEALALDLAGDLVGAEEFEGVAVNVVEAGYGGAEDGALWRVVEADAAFLPELVGGVDVLGDKADLGVAADESVVLCARLGRYEGDDGSAVGRSDGDPAAIEVEAGVGDDAEAELVDVELEAQIVVSDVDGAFEDAQIGALRTFALRRFGEDAGRRGRLVGRLGSGHQMNLPCGVLMVFSCGRHLWSCEIIINPLLIRCTAPCRGLD